MAGGRGQHPPQRRTSACAACGSVAFRAGFCESVKLPGTVRRAGTSFYVNIKKYRYPAELSRSMPMPARALVLIVEDELLVRENAADMLEAAGYATLQASDAAEAIAILESRDDIRVVVTDVQMPGSMDGLRLAALIRDRWPPVEL